MHDPRGRAAEGRKPDTEALTPRGSADGQPRGSPVRSTGRRGPGAQFVPDGEAAGVRQDEKVLERDGGDGRTGA